MNKLFTRIGVAFVGIAMAIGVGVAVGGNDFFKANASTELAYDTVGFETTEGFTAGSTYNNTSIKEDGTKKWGTYYGTASTDNSPRTGSMAMQMRVYNSSENLGYTYSICSFPYATKVSFYFKAGTGNNAAIKLSVFYSLSSGNTGWTAMKTAKDGATDSTNLSTTGSWAQYTAYMPTSVYGNQSNVYFKVAVGSGSTRPEKSSVKVCVDDFTASYLSNDIPVTITGSNTVAAGTPVTYSCDDGVSATWSLTDVSPAGCASIAGSTVTAYINGTATLVCTPSTAGYVLSTKSLTFTSMVLNAGSYYIVSTFDGGVVAESMLGKPTEEVEKNPLGVANDFFNSDNAWTFTKVPEVDNAFVVSNNSFYLSASDASQGISITAVEPSGHWIVSTNGFDSYGNVMYRMSYSESSNRYLAYYRTAPNNSYRNYALPSDSVDLNLIPVSRTLSSLEVSGTLSKTQYAVGESFAPDGSAKVKGTYSNGYTGFTAYIDVTAVSGWNPSTFTAAGNATKVYAKIDAIQSTPYFEVDVADSRVSVIGVDFTETSVTFDFEDISSSATSQLHWTVSGEGGEEPTDPSVSFTSSNPSVATVSSTGLVTAKGVGSTTITITTTDGGLTDTCPVTVNDYVGDYNRISLTDQLWEGREVVFGTNPSSSYNYAMKHYVSGTYVVTSSATYNISKTSMTPSTVEKYTVGIYGDKFTFSYVKDDVTYYLAQTTTRNQAKAIAAEDFDENLCAFSIEISNTGEASIKAPTQVPNSDKDDAVLVDSYLAFNYNNGSNERFAFYTTFNASIGKVALYATSEVETDTQKAQTFIYREMHLRDIEPSEEKTDTNACRSSGEGSKSYYDIAEAAWNDDGFAGARTIILNGSGDYALAKARLAAWAAANGKELNLSTGALGAIYRPNMLDNNSSNQSTLIIVVAISSITLLAVAICFVDKKRKHN